MYARWQLDDQNSPLLPATGSQQSPSSRIEFVSLPMLGLDSQLAAELEGAAWAVAAFAPEDALWADWLYRNLNGYPVATPLIEQPTAHGLPRPDCVSIFPDRRDPHYAGNYPQALEKSGYLVVVCSPHSAHCPEVDAQICAFKKAGGEERIIALIVEGDPNGALEKSPKTVAPEWLPSWLRWRLTGDAFAEADRGEPRIVDARPGRASLKEVRDLLLATLLDIDAWELEVLGSLARPVEVIAAPTPAPVAPVPVVVAPVVAPRRKVGPVVLTAAICVFATLAIAWWSFGSGSSETLPPAAPEENPPAKIVQQTTPPPAEEPAPVPVIAEPAAPAPVAVVSAPPPPPVIAPPQVVVPPVFTAPPLPVAPVAPSVPEEVAATRVAVVALHQRGDVAVGQRRLDDALGFYEEAVDTARVTGPHASIESRTEAALLCRKLGTLQLQMASTSEAKASFVQGRKLLLGLKKQGAWNGDRAKLLAEIEKSLLRLPRD